MMAIRLICAFVVVWLGLAAGQVSAGLITDATFVETPNGSDFNYSITLQNAGTTTVGTFWFGWVPGQDYLATSPISVTSPAGWSDIVTHGGAGDGYAIQWTTSTSLLAPGNSLTFDFESADSPAALEGNSVFYPSVPTTTSFAYQGAPFSGASEQFTVTPAAVPEPSPAPLLLVVAGAGLFCYVVRRSRTHQLLAHSRAS